MLRASETPAPVPANTADPPGGPPARTRNLRARGRATACRQRSLALLVPLLAFCSATAIPAAVDMIKLVLREPELEVKVLLLGTLHTVALTSLVALPLGIFFGLLALILTRQQDPAQRAAALGAAVLRQVRQLGGQPRGAAVIYVGLFGLWLFVGGSYGLGRLFFGTFKNEQLAALLLGCLHLALIALVLLVSAALWVGLERLSVSLHRLRFLRPLGTLYGALGLVVLALAVGVVLLVLRYQPIVQQIDWRYLSYPSLILAGGAGLLALFLWGRHRRLGAGRPAGWPRRVGLAAWAALLCAFWGVCLTTFGDDPYLRTTVLRRSFAAARSYDLLSRALDFDGDGYLSFFGGGDCAPFDKAVHPGAVEIPGNGVDDNCFGGDLSIERLQAPPRRFDRKLPPVLQKLGKPNIVLITLDGLRADRVGAYGYKRKTTPQIDELARSAVLFERAYTQGPSTRYAIPSFLASKYFTQIPHKSTGQLPEPLDDDALLMAEVLKAGGYRTGAALSYQVFSRSWNIDQGFDFYDNSMASYYRGKGTPSWDKDKPYVLLDVAQRFLDQDKEGRRPYFLWVHFFEPHPPYVRRTEHKDFGTDIIGLYDGELRFADAKVGEFLDRLKARADYDRTVIVIASDHGREFGEHGMTSHGYDLYGQSLHVPLIIRVPGLEPRRIENPVAMLDLLPTFVTLAGIKKPFHFEGETLLPQLVDGIEGPPDRPIFSWVQVGFHDSHFINSITTRKYKLIYDVSFNTYQLYDLEQDPQELRDISRREPKELERMKGLLYQLIERVTLPTIQEQIQSSLVHEAPKQEGVLQVNFADKLEFLGFTVQPEQPRAGQVLYISYFIKALAKLDKDRKVVVELRGDKGGFFNAKHVPVNGLYPTSKWIPGQIVRDRQHLRLPGPAQEWTMWLGFAVGHDSLKANPPHKMTRSMVKVGSFRTY